jgi:16S rRNA (adenine1518-N6/adenine1519-N6)-dimethyltransferase
MPEGLRPKKSLGQHFLRSRPALEKIFAAAALTPEDRVLEIGAGDGTLTAPLAERCGAVLALETDRRCLEHLRRRFAETPNVEVVEADVLRYDLGTLAPRAPLACVSNLPYNIATAVLERLLERGLMFSRHVLMFQKEVALRLVAGPRTSAYGSLSLATQYRAEASLVCTLLPRDFTPPPAVASAVVLLVPRAAPLLPPEEERVFAALVRGGFSHRRKTFLNALARSGRSFPPDAVAAGLAELGLTPLARAEEIPLAGYLRLARLLA